MFNNIHQGKGVWQVVSGSLTAFNWYLSLSYSLKKLAWRLVYFCSALCLLLLVYFCTLHNCSLAKALSNNSRKKQQQKIKRKQQKCAKVRHTKLQTLENAFDRHTLKILFIVLLSRPENTMKF